MKSKSYQLLKTRYYKAVDSPNAIGVYVGDLHPNRDVLGFIRTVNIIARNQKQKSPRYKYKTEQMYKELMIQKTGFGCPTGYLYFKEVK